MVSIASVVPIVLARLEDLLCEVAPPPPESGATFDATHIFSAPRAVLRSHYGSRGGWQRFAEPVWHALGADTNSETTYAVHVHQGNLFAAGADGVRCYDPDEQTWTTLNAGLAQPLWSKNPTITALATFDETLYAVLWNGVHELFWLDPFTWQWQPDMTAPAQVRSVLAVDGLFFVGTNNAVYVRTADTMFWTPLGQHLASTVKTLSIVDGHLFAGTFAGKLYRYHVATAQWVLAVPPLGMQFIHAVQRFGAYLYIGGESQTVRCQQTSAQWDAKATCSALSSLQGFPKQSATQDVMVFGGQLFAATPDGVLQFTPSQDAWHFVNDGLLPDAADAPYAFAFTNFEQHLVAGTAFGVYQLDAGL